MRLGIVLAATGAAVTAWAVAAAQDGSLRNGRFPADGSGKAGQYFSRSGATAGGRTAPARAAEAKPAPVPGVRNYYDQLFAEPSGAPAGPAGAASPVRTAGGSDADSADLMNASYDRPTGRSAAGTIRPVAGRAPAPRAQTRPNQVPRAQAPVRRATAPVIAQESNPFLQTSAQDDVPPSEVALDLAEEAAGPDYGNEPDDSAELADDETETPVVSTAELDPRPEAAPAEEPMPTPDAPAYETADFGTSDLGGPRPAGRGNLTLSPASRDGMAAARRTTPEPTAPARQPMPESPSAVHRPVTQTPEPVRGSLPGVNAGDAAERLSEAHMGGPAAVEVQWEKVSEITVGRECRCELVVKNTGAGAAGEVAVEAFFPRSVRLTDADPKPVATEDRLTWTIPALAAGAERRISVMLIPSEQGDLQVSAFVRYTEAAATTLAVREPMLELTVSGDSEAAVGNTVAQTITVSNPGTGTADDVTIEAELPPGLEHAKGSRLSVPVGSLAPGQSQVIQLVLFASQGGPQVVRVRATSGETLRRDAAATVDVAAPALKVAAAGPGLRYVGRDAAYRVRVTNEGAATANNVRVAQLVPGGFRFVRADNGGRFEADPSQIVWYVGSLAAGQSVDLSCSLTAAELGSHRHVVTASGEGGATAEAVVETAVDGTASLVCEVIDLDDPVEVGSETAYEIRVRNEGTKAATNVEVACQIPAEIRTLSARGPTEPRSAEGMLAFPPIASLEPGKTALYRVVVKGAVEGKHRFRVRLTSDSIDEPLVHEELTHYYAD